MFTLESAALVVAGRLDNDVFGSSQAVGLLFMTETGLLDCGLKDTTVLGFEAGLDDNALLLVLDDGVLLVVIVVGTIVKDALLAEVFCVPVTGDLNGLNCVLGASVDDCILRVLRRPEVTGLTHVSLGVLLAGPVGQGEEGGTITSCGAWNSAGTATQGCC